MDCIATRIPYRQTNQFSKIIVDYLDRDEALKSFYSLPPSVQGIQKAIQNREGFTHRGVLVQELQKQYANGATDLVSENIQALLSENTFTITTAHQPNIFTGPLYIIYKILHVIKLAEYCKASLPQYNFVPVYYMGSEDHDLDELGHIFLGAQRIEWKTKQTGAVGRMKVDREFTKLIELATGQLAVLPFGNEIISLMKKCYVDGSSIQDATFKLFDHLFGEYGLIVLIADNPNFKKLGAAIFEDDLFNEAASNIVEKTASRLHAAGYKLQATARDTNLFYLKDSMRERLVRVKDKFITHESRLTFNEKEILQELSDHPDRFSPNVILRGIYQETILPNLAYIGGAGELAYWLQLKDLFENYNVPYPVLVLRNSFLVIEKKWSEKIGKLGFSAEDFFLSEQELMNRLVARESRNEIKLNGNFTSAENLYDSLKKQAVAVDSTLAQHVDALKTQSIYRLQELEKKMIRAEKRKFSDQQRQIHSIREKLFPGNGLQERVDNVMYYYAKWGKDFIERIYEHSLGLEQEFVLLKCIDG